jgi:glyoxylase-like metal-dependent hydrolase (beta-lactamase superfamily II)
MLIKDAPAEITDRLVMLGTSAYPLFLFKGEGEGTVVEGGVGAMGPLVLEQMETLGIEREFVKQVVVTHAHPDHVMAVPLFRRMFPGITVLASETAAKTLTVEKAISFFTQVDEALTGALLKAGMITEKHRPEPLDEMQIAVDRTIKDGDTVAAGGVSLDVLETPGHSECSLSFFEPSERILVISDASGYYVPDHDYWWPNYFTGYRAYLDSIDRLAALGADVLCLSHNAVIQGAEEVESYFGRAIAATQQFHEQIVESANSGKSVRQIAEELGSAVYEKTQLMPLDFFQKNCGLLVKQSCKHEGISVEK